ncbi:MAG: glycosyltransferase family 2 protein [Ignavibacteriae bacterium]|nr:glycosyltransferase family 2 protein [Ignavibacteriota bacterium]
MPQDNNLILSVVIVNWNSRQATSNCLDSVYTDRLFSEYAEKAEVILIDNNSSDGSQEELKEKYPSVKLIQNKENYGYAKASNQGIESANGKYILLLGNDTIIKNDALYKTVRFMENLTECGAAGCRLVYPGGRLQGNCKKFPKLKNAFFTYLSLHRFNQDYDMIWFGYDKTIEVDQIATTFLMIRKDVLDKTGGFDEQYKILYNDVDLCKRIWNAGYKIYFNHTIEIEHIGSHSTKKAGFKVRKIMYDDILRYYRNNFGFKANLLIPVLYLRLIFVSLFK